MQSPSRLNYLPSFGKTICLSPTRENSFETTLSQLLVQTSPVDLLQRSLNNVPNWDLAESGSKAISTSTVDSELLMLFGHANEFKEGDASINIAASDAKQQLAARAKLAGLKLEQVTGYKFINDEISALLESTIDKGICERISQWTFAFLKQFLLERPPEEIKQIMPGLRSEVIAGVAKLMSIDELIKVSSKIYNSSEAGALGSDGVFSSRIQPNSPTDDPEEVLFSVLEGLSYGCGDAVFGINIVAADTANITALEATLKDVVVSFQLENVTKWCVLAHIDDQALVERLQPNLIDCAFQSIGGTEAVNKIFNISVRSLKENLGLARSQYFETGQGSAVTNRAACGIDMVTLEARAHGLARALMLNNKKWTIVNTVAGFIGPEVFKTKDQLLRACLEDLFMGKLHGLVFGLDICSTYHMSLEIDDMFWIQDQVMAAGPGFYMAVAGNSDPMLSYLTTSYRDHPRLREKHHKSVTQAMHQFLQRIGIMNAAGQLTEKAGDTEWLYVCYKRAKGSDKSDMFLRQEARAILSKLQKRGLDLGYGHDGKFNAPQDIRERHFSTYNEAKRVIFLNFNSSFLANYPDALTLGTEALNRIDYCSKPSLGEKLVAADNLRNYARNVWATNDTNGKVCIQIVFSDGLNASSVDCTGHGDAFYKSASKAFQDKGFLVSAQPVIIKNARVRAGYAVGSLLFSVNSTCRAGVIVNCIGERPGNGKNTFSVYIACASSKYWAEKKVDHHCVDVVSGISQQALNPEKAVENVLYFITRRLQTL